MCCLFPQHAVPYNLNDATRADSSLVFCDCQIDEIPTLFFLNVSVRKKYTTRFIWLLFLLTLDHIFSAASHTHTTTTPQVPAHPFIGET